MRREHPGGNEQPRSREAAVRGRAAKARGLASSVAGRILVIHAERDVRTSIFRALGEAGYKVRSAATGSVGFEIARSWQPDLVLLGRVLPDLESADLGRLLERGQGTCRIPVALISDPSPGRLSDGDGERGFAVLLARPFTDSGLLETVDRTLQSQVGREGPG